MHFTTKLSEAVARVETALAVHVPRADTRPARLHAAMRYSLEAGGKRLRPVMLVAAAELRGVPPADPLPAAVAVECLHTYSLIHDDLPCMDDDDWRRGRPSCHVKFGEANALLAGDALLTKAFEVLAERETARCAAAVVALARAAGDAGMVGGQVLDLGLSGHSARRGDVERMHALKTGALIAVSAELGAILAGADSVKRAEAVEWTTRFLKVLGGPAGGFIADKGLKSPSRYLKWAFLALLPLMAVILSIPKGESYIYAGMAATLSFALVVFTMRGVFWAPMSEVGIPSRISGSAFGIGCLIGYAPGMFAYIIYGALLDQYPGEQGYTYVFTLMSVLAVIGFLVSSLLHRSVNRRVAAPTGESLA